MMRIEEIIPELLAQNNCVVVPGFGGFIAKVNPAVIDHDRGVMYPPYKSVLYNRQLKADDGLLIHSLAQKDGKSYTIIAQLVSERVADWNKAMNLGGRLEIERLGVFHKLADGSIRFEQDRHFNLLLSSFGLESVRFASSITEQRKADLLPDPNIEKTVKEPKVIQLEVEEETNIVPQPIRRKRSFAKIAAASVLIPIAFYSIWIPTRTDVLESGVLSLNDFNPFYKKEKGNYTPDAAQIKIQPVIETTDLEVVIDELPEELEIYSYRFSPDKFIQVDLGKEVDDMHEVSEQPEVLPNTMNFIVGCFANESNATNLVKKLKASGLPAFIVDQQNGLHRVSAGSALSIEQMEEIEQGAEALGFKGWVLK